jgi:hypothetical protein
VTLLFLQDPRHVANVGPVGVGKSPRVHALGHVARRGHSVLALRTDRMRESLKHACLGGFCEAEPRRLVAETVGDVREPGVPGDDAERVPGPSCVMTSLVRPSAQRNGTGMPPSWVVVRKGTSCSRSERWFLEVPSVMKGPACPARAVGARRGAAR